MFKFPKWMVAMAMAVTALAQSPDSWPDPGPPATRDLFPLNLVPLTYRPASAVPLGAGRALVSLQITRANVFEFSERIKDALSQDPGGRITVTQASSEAFAASHPQDPLIYFFDVEVQRTELAFRYGATARTDLALTLAWQGYGGGFLDGLIEGVHKLGFDQAGRNGVAKDQAALVVIQKGQVVLFTQTPMEAHPEDPVLSFLHRIHESPRLTVSLTGNLQLPLTRWRSTFQSDWDSSLGLNVQWRPSPNQVVDGGAAYLRRHLKQQGPAPFFVKDQAAGHLGWEWRGWRWGRPFLTLVATGGITLPGPGSKLDRPSLIHDLGVHLRLTRRSALTVSYINNITHNENTADMGVALRLSFRP